MQLIPSGVWLHSVTLPSVSGWLLPGRRPQVTLTETTGEATVMRVQESEHAETQRDYSPTAVSIAVSVSWR